MNLVKEVPILPLSLEPYKKIVGKSRYNETLQKAKITVAALPGRIVWHINSTPVGGGVAEILPTLLGYKCWTGLDTRWLVIWGDPRFFAITKRIHNYIHGSQGDGGPLEKSESLYYEEIHRKNSAELTNVIQPGDIVILHDPHTLGLARALKKLHTHVVWRCHIGNNDFNLYARHAWNFLKPYFDSVDHLVFTRMEYAPRSFDKNKITIIPPSIDVFSPKNQPMDYATVKLVMSHVGLIQSNSAVGSPHLRFTRRDGTQAKIRHVADIIHAGRLPNPRTPLIVQLSRWDRLKDMIGVMSGFSDYVTDSHDGYLILAGPNVHSVADDPEGLQTYQECCDAWHQLPHFKRKQILLACLPMMDPEENAAITNALQRYATVVIQKSLYEGFGLTVTEAMWKGKPVIGSRVGGIQDQIIDGKTGILVQDPSDLRELGNHINSLLSDSHKRRKMGEAAKERVIEYFLVLRHMNQYFDLYNRIVDCNSEGISTNAG